MRVKRVQNTQEVEAENMRVVENEMLLKAEVRMTLKLDTKKWRVCIYLTMDESCHHLLTISLVKISLCCKFYVLKYLNSFRF